MSTPFQRNVSTPFQRTGLVTVLYAQPEHEGRAVVGKASVVQPHIPVLFVTEYLWQLAERADYHRALCCPSPSWQLGVGVILVGQADQVAQADVLPLPG